ncbi:MAG: ABC transporter permease [Gammaproteobacteria bacterium]|nr:MAG: ABC transporter permease [Gammaproteobacteria bacterium]RLA30374.1 MAG: ABC transporter permease [Gammaproteobacteria bacterium]
MNIVLRLAWRNLWRQPRRTWLTIGAMVFSNALLVFMISLQFGMYELMIDNTLQVFTGHIQVQAPGYKDDLKMRQVVPDANQLAEDLREQLDLQAVTARAATFSLISSEERTYGVQIFGVDPAREASVSTIPGLVKKGRFPTDTNAAEIVIGTVLARNLRVGIGDELTLLGSGRDGSFAAAVAEVVGIFDSGVADIDRSIAEIPLAFFQDVFFMQGAGHMVVITTPDLTVIDEYAQRTEALLPADSGLVVHDWTALQPGLKQAIQADLSSAFFMYGVLVILVAFSVLNTQLMSVLERTHEFGVVMALGLTPGRLGRLVIIETAMLGFAGLLIGALIGGLVTLYFTYNGFSYPGMDEMAANFNLPDRFYPKATLLTLFLGPAVVFIGSILSALYPALRLHWLHPVEAMRAL